MSCNMLKELNRCLRLDEMSTQEVRKTGEHGKLASLHEVWQNVNEECQIKYMAGPCVTLDEALLSSRGRSWFKVYML